MDVTFYHRFARKASSKRFVAHPKCTSCGAKRYLGNADDVASINIETAGHAVLAHGEVAQSGASIKWEPTEEPRFAA